MWVLKKNISHKMKGRISKNSLFFSTKTCLIERDFFLAPRMYVKSTVKPILRGHSKTDQKLAFKTDYPFLQVKSIAGFTVIV